MDQIWKVSDEWLLRYELTCKQNLKLNLHKVNSSGSRNFILKIGPAYYDDVL